MNSGRPATADFDYAGADGVTRHFLSRVNVVRNSNGEPHSVLVISRDISQRRALEVERERLLDELTRSQAAVKTLKDLLRDCVVTMLDQK